MASRSRLAPAMPPIRRARYRRRRQRTHATRASGTDAPTAGRFSATAFLLRRDYTERCFPGETDMAAADTSVRARIDAVTKRRAALALKAVGLSMSDAIRLFLCRIADERRLPFDPVANARTRRAIAELEAGRGRRARSVAALLATMKTDR